MSDTTANNKRIAKNTVFLYFRMILIMGVSLYTSRVVLDALGVEDYGIYNVVGGIVVMFSIISQSLSASITRFITYELATDNKERQSTIFSTSINILIVLSCIVVLFAETIGLWFLNTKMIIPDARMTAANWVYQLSILTFVINLINVPYNASIIAHERMSAFAYIGILEALGRLGIAFLITLSPFDRLVFYAILLTVVAFMIRLVYRRYCIRRFPECSYNMVFDRSLFGQMLGFSGWNFIGATSSILRDQGGNIVINLFCGPTVNAARGIAFQVNGAVHHFASNFMTALNPQITKSYATGNKAYMMTLIFQGARLSFYMLLFLSMPIIINTSYILSLWLKAVPNHTILFVRLVMLFAMLESLSSPLITAMLATGKIRNYQIVVGGLQMMNLPVSYILLRNGCIPETTLLVAICISQLCLAARLLMLRKMIGLPVAGYLKQVYLNVAIVSLLSSVVPVIAFNYMREGFMSFVSISIMACCCTMAVVYFVGLSSDERNVAKQQVRKIFNKLPI